MYNYVYICICPSIFGHAKPYREIYEYYFDVQKRG